jgi:hypothetical protein
MPKASDQSPVCLQSAADVAQHAAETGADGGEAGDYDNDDEGSDHSVFKRRNGMDVCMQSTQHAADLSGHCSFLCDDAGPAVRWSGACRGRSGTTVLNPKGSYRPVSKGNSGARCGLGAMTRESRWRQSHN